MRLTREVLSLPRAVETDCEIVAVGDIHGRLDLLDALLAEAASEPRRAPSRRLIFTGDLVDRGADSLGALALAAAAKERIEADQATALMGNHEILMRLALDPSTPPNRALQAFAVWVGNGGDAVIEELLGPAAPWGNPRRLLQALRAAAPRSVLDWLEALETHTVSGRVLFVHAGVNPTIQLEEFLAEPWDAPIATLDEDLHWAWVRRPFLDHEPRERGFSDYFVVHGHTPLDRGYTRSHAEQVRRFRINLDGGSAMTGIAKMAILRGSLAEIVTAEAS
jgi:serine/threonine protein phosphatase 1